jgi:hypothetical protein
VERRPASGPPLACLDNTPCLRERSYDNSVERVSGWYKRRSQIALAAIGLVVPIVLYADTSQIARTLWLDKTIRAAVVAEAGRVTQQGN